MTPKPTGRLLASKEGRDLVLTRSFRAPIEDVWASITESDRTGRWFASWTGEPGPGNTIRATLQFEEGKPETDMTIDACEPPRHVAVSSHDVFGTWRLEATLVERDGVTELTFVQHLDEGVGIGEVGPGLGVLLGPTRVLPGRGDRRSGLRRLLPVPEGVLRAAHPDDPDDDSATTGTRLNVGRPVRTGPEGVDRGVDRKVSIRTCHRGAGGPARVKRVPGGSTAQMAGLSQWSSKTSSPIGRRRTGPWEPRGRPSEIVAAMATTSGRARRSRRAGSHNECHIAMAPP
jgi:uncharacterized protein YndB with AHSA1/START domain